MTIVDSIKKILKPVSAPATHLIRSKNFPSISFHIINRRITLRGDGKPKREAASCQVDIWTENGESSTIVREVTEAMSKAGWRYVPDDDSLDMATGIYQKTLIFNREFGTEEYDG